MKVRETPQDDWEYVMIKTEAEVNAVVQDTEPTGSENVWFDTSDESEVTVPTMTDLGAVENTLNQLALIGNMTAINQNGTYTKENVTGMTANHKVANWGLFSDANLTTPISPNNPPADITIAEESGGYVITIANYTSAFYMKPTFILPQN